ncbi:hypothetical protein DL96DRAFT_1573920, partial [Flagelloscypha sp. PMI_526]
MPSVTSAISDFTNAVVNIFAQLGQSLIAVFQAIIALFWNAITSILHLGQSVIQLFFELFQGVAGFIVGTIGNFLILGVLGGGYYFYTTRQNGRKNRLGKG